MDKNDAVIIGEHGAMIHLIQMLKNPYKTMLEGQKG